MTDRASAQGRGIVDVLEYIGKNDDLELLRWSEVGQVLTEKARILERGQLSRVLYGLPMNVDSGNRVAVPGKRRGNVAPVAASDLENANLARSQILLPPQTLNGVPDEAQLFLVAV